MFRLLLLVLFFCFVSALDFSGSDLPTTYNFKTQLNSGPDVWIYWQGTNASSTTLTLVLRSQTLGWTAIGFNTGFQMVGSDAVLGYYSSGTQYISPYALTAQTTAGLSAASFAVSNTVVQEDSSTGITSVGFTRSLSAGQNPLVYDGSTGVVFAAIGGSDALVQHTTTTVSYSVNWFTGSAQSVHSFDTVDLHQLLAWLAFGVAFPAAILFKRYWASPSDDKERYLAQKETAFQLHVALHSLGVCLLLATFILAFYMKRPGSAVYQQQHMGLGISVFSILLFQYLSSFFRPDPGPTLARKVFEILHPLLGVSVLVMGWVNVFLGIQQNINYNTTTRNGLTAGWGALIATVLLLVAILEAIRSPTTAHSKTETDKNDVTVVDVDMVQKSPS